MSVLLLIFVVSCTTQFPFVNGFSVVGGVGGLVGNSLRVTINPQHFMVTGRVTEAPTEKITTTTTTEEKIQLATTLLKKYGEQSLGSAFIQRVSELLLFLSEHNHTVVPKRYAPNPTLGNWVNKQRQQYRIRNQTGKSSLSEERVEVLDAMGFEWTPNPGGAAVVRSDQAWLDNLESLREFKEQHGHCRVPSSTKLGRWTVLQRMHYKNQQQTPTKNGSTNSSNASGSKLTQERIDKLNALGFEWSSKWEDVWNERIAQLREFRDTYGHCAVPIHYNENLQLANWVSTQRKNYRRRAMGKKSALTVERIRQLDELGFVWNFWENEMQKWKGEEDGEGEDFDNGDE